MRPHQGIRIDSIPAQGVGGLIFVFGIASLFWIGVPAFRPLVGLCLLGGALLAPVLYKLH